MSETYRSQPPLFENQAEYDAFKARHAKAAVPQADFPADYAKPVHIGIDSGSTTVKVAVIDEDAKLLFTDYRPNQGDPIALLQTVLLGLYESHPKLNVASVTTTGYGEDLAKAAFHADFGVVETVAHFTAAKHFMPDVDFIIDIGGQDMKCFKIENGAISDIFLNEACSSGCGSFLQTFAQALGYDVKDFTKLGLFADRPVDLGSRCTVFMNSSVKQAQKDGASVENISAGLSISVVKNAIYKVIRASSPEELGRHVVVQGGTFYNEAVLRAFEKEMGVEVIRPNIAGLMGAYGAALYGMQKGCQGKPQYTPDRAGAAGVSTGRQRAAAAASAETTASLPSTPSPMADGSSAATAVSGPSPAKRTMDRWNLYEYKRQLILGYKPGENRRGRIGLPLCLNFWELYPFWYTFFTKLGFQVVHSPMSSRKLYLEGQGSIPSDTACFPAKLAHGHIEFLAKLGAGRHFLPLHDLQHRRGPGPEPLQLPGGGLLPGGAGRATATA